MAQSPTEGPGEVAFVADVRVVSGRRVEHRHGGRSRRHGALEVAREQLGLRDVQPRPGEVAPPARRRVGLVQACPHFDGAREAVACVVHVAAKQRRVAALEVRPTQTP
jgi:hypothetical protein